MTLCFLEESLGNHREALQALDMTFLDTGQVPATELMSSWHLPDVIEAMVGVGRLDEAESSPAHWNRTASSTARPG